MGTDILATYDCCIGRGRWPGFRLSDSLERQGAERGQRPCRETSTSKEGAATYLFIALCTEHCGGERPPIWLAIRLFNKHGDYTAG